MVEPNELLEVPSRPLRNRSFFWLLPALGLLVWPGFDPDGPRVIGLIVLAGLFLFCRAQELSSSRDEQEDPKWPEALGPIWPYCVLFIAPLLYFAPDRMAPVPFLLTCPWLGFLTASPGRRVSRFRLLPILIAFAPLTFSSSKYQATDELLALSLRWSGGLFFVASLDWICRQPVSPHQALRQLMKPLRDFPRLAIWLLPIWAFSYLVSLSLKISQMTLQESFYFSLIACREEYLRLFPLLVACLCYPLSLAMARWGNRRLWGTGLGATHGLLWSSTWALPVAWPFRPFSVVVLLATLAGAAIGWAASRQVSFPKAARRPARLSALVSLLGGCITAFWMSEALPRTGPAQGQLPSLTRSLEAEVTEVQALKARSADIASWLAEATPQDEDLRYQRFFQAVTWQKSSQSSRSQKIKAFLIGLQCHPSPDRVSRDKRSDLYWELRLVGGPLAAQEIKLLRAALDSDRLRDLGPDGSLLRVAALEMQVIRNSQVSPSFKWLLAARLEQALQAWRRLESGPGELSRADQVWGRFTLMVIDRERLREGREALDQNLKLHEFRNQHGKFPDQLSEVGEQENRAGTLCVGYQPDSKHDSYTWLSLPTFEGR